MKRVRALGALFLTTVLMVGIVSLNIPASAQGGSFPTRTPQASPTGNGGKAAWNVIDTTFESNYPNGVKFGLEVTSSGGKLKSATVYWRHQPLGARKRVNGTIDAGGTKVTANFASAGSDAVPQWMEFEYWWVLTDEAGNSYETPHQIDEYADTKHRWKRAESQDIILFYEEGVPDDLANKALEAMAKQRPFYVKNWPILLPYRPRAVIYNGFKTMNEWAPKQGTVSAETGAFVAGFTVDDWGATVQVFLSDTPEFVAYATIPHEVGHLYQYANGSLRRRPPMWFYEGDAVYFELIETDQALQRARIRAASGNLPSLNGNNLPATSAAGDLPAYDVGYAFWKWLAETFGDDAHYKVWALMNQGVLWSDALQRVTSMSFTDMEVKFRTWLGASDPIPPTPIPSPVFTFPPTPTPAK